MIKAATVQAGKIVCVFVLFLAFTKADAQNKNETVSGYYRGTFLIRDSTEVPFNFEIRPDNKVYFINSTEHFEAGIARVKGDSVLIPIDQFDNVLVFGKKGEDWSGSLRKQDGSGTALLVNAKKNAKYRFRHESKITAADLSGTYDIVFHNPNGTEEKAVGLFKQDGDKLTGTFLRITGDSRFLEGVTDGRQFRLSSFIGSGPGYYTGTIDENGKLSGEVIGIRGNQKFTGTLNEDARLPDPYTLTFLKNGYSHLDFSFPDLKGNKVSLSDSRFKNKVVVITITGTWCPNCIDEAAFLSPWYNKNKSRGVEAIAIHYERNTDPAYLSKVIGRFKKKFDIQYDQLIGGVAHKQLVGESLPALNSFLAFPTIIFINRKGEVAKIHTGYSGPATGEHYEKFKQEFNAEIDQLLSE